MKVLLGNGETAAFEKWEVFDALSVSLDERFVLVDRDGVAVVEPIGENFVLIKGKTARVIRAETEAEATRAIGS